MAIKKEILSMFRFLAVLALWVGSTNVLAQEDDASYVGFDSLVSELKASAEEPLNPPPRSEWEDVAIHFGAGIVTSFVSVTSPEGQSGAGVMKGFEVHVGANLFSTKARAEMLFRNYTSEPLSSTLTADLREFELRLVFMPLVRNKMHLRTGAGFSARYMDLSTRAFTLRSDHSASTPTSSFFLGFERKLTPALTVGPDISYHSAVVSDTFDKSAWNASLKLNATF